MNPVNLNHHGMIDLIGHAGPMAQFILLLLLCVSVFSWAVILLKWRVLKRAHRENSKFLHLFWSSKNVEEIYSKSEAFESSPVAALFQAGFKELKKFSTPSGDDESSSGFEVDNIARALLRSTNTEVTHLEKYVSWLATTASATPFIGLFGTVWGIMNAFQNIGVTGAANLAIVAPGISEALVATAAGLGAAIPAVIAYNYFVNQIKRVVIDMDCFSQDFLNIVQRSIASRQKVFRTEKEK